MKGLSRGVRTYFNSSDSGPFSFFEKENSALSDKLKEVRAPPCFGFRVSGFRFRVKGFKVLVSGKDVIDR